MNLRMDLRDLAPPEPMQRILDALEALEPSRCLEALTPFRPVPLLSLLDDMGYAWHVAMADDGHARVTICRMADVALLPE